MKNHLSLGAAKRTGWGTVLLALASIVGGDSFAREYFVAPAGKDGDGLSEQTAFSSIGKALGVLKPGDVLTILPGNYFGSTSARISGTPTAPIVIRAKRPGTALVRGDVDAPAFRPAQGLEYTYATDFNRPVEGIAERSTRRIYEPMLSAAEVELMPASFYQDSQTRRLYVHTSDSANPDGHALALSVTNGFGILLTPPGGASTVHDVVIDGLSFTGYQAREFPPEPGSRNRWGLHVVMPERVVVRRCTAFLNNGGIFLLAPIESVVEDCYAFANVSRFLDLGNNILGWSGSDTTFRRNRVESFWSAGTSTSDITFYGGARYDKRPTRGLMEGNLAINAGLMVKGAFGPDTHQKGNIVVGRGAYFYRPPDDTNLLLPDHESPTARRSYADPINGDFRLQSDSPLRGQGAGSKDPGPFPYREEVFYVSPGGNDSLPGTSLKQAWRTLAHACKSAKSGQTVYVTAGEYRESLVPANSGTADRPIRLLRYGRDRVVLDGHGGSSAGIDLSGKSHIEVRGFMVRNFAQGGVRATQANHLRLHQLLVLPGDGDGAQFSAVTGLVLEHNLLGSTRGAGLRLENCPDATVTGNVFDMTSGPRLICDAATLGGLWSDGNDFVPGAGPYPLISAGQRSFASLDAWQQASGRDPTSIQAPIGYRDRDPQQCDFTLGADSPLRGRGPHSSTIGPFLRLKVKVPVAVENVRVHQVVDTAATIQWWTPKTAVAGRLEYGETPNCPKFLDAPTGSFHIASLTGLAPGKKYFFRAGAPGMGEEIRFAPYAVETPANPAAAAAARPREFVTASARPAPRTFHVATSGSDARSGLSVEEAWRSIAHAATQVRAGDTVLIHAGKYEEYVLVRATGDEGAPITFRAAPGETVWMEGSDRFRTTAFQLVATHHIHIDGIRFRHFRYAPHSGDVINISGGTGHVIRRCFYDGREPNGYVGNFVRAGGTRLLLENCVMINGMGEGLSGYNCPEITIRNCVFYDNFIRAMSSWNFEPDAILTVSHNLFCDTIPEKTGNAFIRINHLESLRADHNAYFARKGPEERRLVETAKIGGKAVGKQMPGTYRGVDLLLADVQRQAGQEMHSRFGNPGIRVVAELLPSKARESEWRKIEMQWDGKAFREWDFGDFQIAPGNPLGTASDGKPIGLDPAAFR